MAITTTHDAPQSHTALLSIRHSSSGPPHPPLMPCTPSLPLPCPTRSPRMMYQTWVDSVSQYCLLSLDACSTPACHLFRHRVGIPCLRVGRGRARWHFSSSGSRILPLALPYPLSASSAINSARACTTPYQLCLVPPLPLDSKWEATKQNKT